MTQVLRRLTSGSGRLVETAVGPSSVAGSGSLSQLTAAYPAAATPCTDAAPTSSQDLSFPHTTFRQQASLNAASAAKNIMTAHGDSATTSEITADGVQMRLTSTAEQQPRTGSDDSADDVEGDIGGDNDDRAAGTRGSRRWTEQEHSLLGDLVAKYGTYRTWTTIAQRLPGRTGKQCRERWLNHMSPDSKKGYWTHDEELIFIRHHAAIGNHWSRISKHLPGRSDNCVKNHWNATLRAKRPCGRPSSLLWVYVSHIKKGADKQAALEQALRQAPKGSKAQPPPAAPAAPAAVRLPSLAGHGQSQGVVTADAVAAHQGANTSSGMVMYGADQQGSMRGHEAADSGVYGGGSRVSIVANGGPFAAAARAVSVPLREAPSAGIDVPATLLLRQLDHHQQQQQQQQQQGQQGCPGQTIGDADVAAVALMALSGRASQEGSLPLLLDEAGQGCSWSPLGPHPKRTRSLGQNRMQALLAHSMQQPEQQQQGAHLQQHEMHKQHHQQQQGTHMQQHKMQQQHHQQQQWHDVPAAAAPVSAGPRQSPFQVPTTMLPLLEHRHCGSSSAFLQLMRSASLSIGAASIYGTASGLGASRCDSSFAAPFSAAAAHPFGLATEGSAVSVLRNMCRVLEDMEQPVLQQGQAAGQQGQQQEWHMQHEQQEGQEGQQRQQLQLQLQQQGHQREQQHSEDGSALRVTQVPPTPPSSAATSVPNSPAPPSPALVDTATAQEKMLSQQQQQQQEEQQGAVAAVGLGNLSLLQREALLSMLAEHQALPQGLSEAASIEIRVVLPPATGPCSPNSNVVTSGADSAVGRLNKPETLPSASGRGGVAGTVADVAALTQFEVRDAVMLGKRSASDMGATNEQQHAAKRLA